MDGDGADPWLAAGAATPLAQGGLQVRRSADLGQDERVPVGSGRTSLPTLTSVPDTYIAALFSGRHMLAPNDDSSYHIDCSVAHFRRFDTIK